MTFICTLNTFFKAHHKTSNYNEAGETVMLASGNPDKGREMGRRSKRNRQHRVKENVSFGASFPSLLFLLKAQRRRRPPSCKGKRKGRKKRKNLISSEPDTPTTAASSSSSSSSAVRARRCP
jgi:hypothetical protein